VLEGRAGVHQAAGRLPQALALRLLLLQARNTSPPRSRTDTNGHETSNLPSRSLAQNLMQHALHVAIQAAKEATATAAAALTGDVAALGQPIAAVARPQAAEAAEAQVHENKKRSLRPVSHLG
jgi:hypothetical protein